MLSSSSMSSAAMWYVDNAGSKTNVVKEVVSLQVAWSIITKDSHGNHCMITA